MPGALQLVFLDLGTPKDDQWNAYDELKLLLTARGVPEASIRYIHEAKNDKQKASIFSAAREGRIAVLMGSTTRMGVGTNVQARAVALHDVDCPWRPADVAQRHGRILRQLNQNSEVEIYQYVVTGTFAAYMWQTIERKARFISQVMRGRLDVREIEDLPSDVLSAAEAKALASGNPLLLERSVALNEVGRLERLERAWHRNQTTVHATAKGLERRIDQLQANISAYQQALARVHDLSGDRFHMTITQRACTTRTAAAASLAQWARNTGIQYARPHEERARGQVGEISGFTVTARTRSVLGNPVVVFQFEGIPETEVRVPTEHVLDGDGVGVIRQIENRLSSLPDRISKAQLELPGASAQPGGRPALPHHPVQAHRAARRGTGSPRRRRRAARHPRGTSRTRPRPSQTRTHRLSRDRPSLARTGRHWPKLEPMTVRRRTYGTDH
ncbi:helicase-related protein [Pseudoxanthomonas mexicana]